MKIHKTQKKHTPQIHSQNCENMINLFDKCDENKYG